MCSTLMQGCVRRMTGLIDNVLDFARGRLGGGLVLDRNAKEPLEPTLLHVIDELQTAWPDRMIDLSLGVIGGVDCDRARVGQLVSNLVSNALVHGTPRRRRSGSAARMEDHHLVIEVSNTGEPIPAAVLDMLFHPFVRMASPPQQHGLGLGLYIASEIAKAHGGTLTATPSKEETRFTFRTRLRQSREGTESFNSALAQPITCFCKDFARFHGAIGRIPRCVLRG